MHVKKIPKGGIGAYFVLDTNYFASWDNQLVIVIIFMFLTFKKKVNFIFKIGFEIENQKLVRTIIGQQRSDSHDRRRPW